MKSKPTQASWIMCGALTARSREPGCVWTQSDHRVPGWLCRALASGGKRKDDSKEGCFWYSLKVRNQSFQRLRCEHTGINLHVSPPGIGKIRVYFKGWCDALCTVIASGHGALAGRSISCCRQGWAPPSGSELGEGLDKPQWGSIFPKVFAGQTI